MLARWARQSGGGARVLHRTHGWSIVVPFVLFITGIVAVNMKPGPATFLLVPLSGATWGLQFVLTSALLGTYAVRTPPNL
jgi:drug/metabolite transporter (DMT)-like permease